MVSCHVDRRDRHAPRLLSPPVGFTGRCEIGRKEGSCHDLTAGCVTQFSVHKALSGVLEFSDGETLGYYFDRNAPKVWFQHSKYPSSHGETEIHTWYVIIFFFL